MRRREFLKFSVAGLAVAVGTMGDWPVFWRGAGALAASLRSGTLDLDMVEADAEMVDGILVRMWAFKVLDTDHHDANTIAGGARIPGPTLVALEGDRIRARVRNSIRQGGAHGFAIPGVTLTSGGQDVTQVTVPEGETREVEFTAPAAGTYMYLDPLNAPVNRTMGLHGALIVLPDPVGNNAPYSNLAGGSAVQRLFDDLGTASHFPGNPWDPSRNAVWVFNCIDPDKAAAAATGAGVSAATFQQGFLPQYFTLNGKSGFFAAQHNHPVAPGQPEDHSHHGENRLSFGDGRFDSQGSVSIRGTVGQPIIIRTMNAGLMWQSPHIHGNHVYLLSQANIAGGRTISPNVFLVDTWSMEPGAIKDVLLPFIQPPDIPPAVWPPVQEKFPLMYPMHDHNEISNTAAGGNYPQGCATHWQIDGPYDPASPETAFITVTKAELRVKTGQLILEGRCSVPGLTLDVHGGGTTGSVINNRIRVGDDRSWEFRGRALKALGSRFVTLMHHDENDAAMVHAVRTVPLKMK